MPTPALASSVRSGWYEGEWIHSGEATISCFFLPAFWKGVYSKRKEFAPKGVYSKRKEFAPFGSKFFPFRVDPFQKGIGMQGSKQELPKVVYLVKMAKSLPSVWSPLKYFVWEHYSAWQGLTFHANCLSLFFWKKNYHWFAQRVVKVTIHHHENIRI